MQQLMRPYYGAQASLQWPQCGSQPACLRHPPAHARLAAARRPPLPARRVRQLARLWQRRAAPLSLLRPRRPCSHSGRARGLLQAGLTTRPARAADSKHPQADAGFFQRREFCFTMDGDIFVRYQSFKARGERGPALRASSERGCRIALLLPREASACSGSPMLRFCLPV